MSFEQIKSKMEKIIVKLTNTLDASKRREGMLSPVSISTNSELYTETRVPSMNKSFSDDSSITFQSYKPLLTIQVC